MEITLNFEFVNWWAVMAATLIVFLLGGVWYSPALFGRLEKATPGHTPPSGRNISGVFVIAFLFQWLTVGLLAAVLGPNATVGYGLTVGLLVGCFFVTTSIGITNIWDRKPLIHLAVNGGYHIVSFAIIGIILGTWH